MKYHKQVLLYFTTSTTVLVLPLSLIAKFFPLWFIFVPFTIQGFGFLLGGYISDIEKGVSAK